METLLEFSNQKEQLIAGEEMDAYSFSHEALDCAARNIFEQFKDWHNSLSLPSKPVGDVEESGYAAAPQKGMEERIKKHVMHFEFWKSENFKQVMSNGWENKIVDERANYQRRYTIHELYDLFVTTIDESPSPSEAGDGYKFTRDKLLDLIHHVQTCALRENNSLIGKEYLDKYFPAPPIQK